MHLKKVIASLLVGGMVCVSSMGVFASSPSITYDKAHSTYVADTTTNYYYDKYNCNGTTSFDFPEMIYSNYQGNRTSLPLITSSNDCVLDNYNSDSSWSGSFDSWDCLNSTDFYNGLYFNPTQGFYDTPEDKVDNAWGSNTTYYYTLNEYILNHGEGLYFVISKDGTSATGIYPYNYIGTSYNCIRHDYDCTLDTVYTQGSLVQSNIVAPDGAYPDNGRASDGYWYVKKGAVASASNVKIEDTFKSVAQNNSKDIWKAVEDSISSSKGLFNLLS